MRARKHLTFGQRMTNLGYGVIGIIAAIVIAQEGDFEFSGVVAFVVGAFAAGSIFRGVFGYDEV